METERTARDELISRAKQRAETPPVPENWGSPVQLSQNDVFTGRWRSETTDADNNDRRVFLLWDEQGEPCFMRFYAALGREIDRVQPTLGCTIVIYRGENYSTQYDVDGEPKGQAYGVETEPSDNPLPAEAPSPGHDDDVPF